MEDGAFVRLSGEELGPNRLDHAYATTVHRSQGTTVRGPIASRTGEDESWPTWP